MGMVVREIGPVSRPNYRWRREYGELGVNHVKRLRELDRENRRLNRLVAD